MKTPNYRELSRNLTLMFSGLMIGAVSGVIFSLMSFSVAAIPLISAARLVAHTTIGQ